MKEKNSEKLKLGVVTGAVLGAVIGYCLAPDKNSKSYGKIMEKGEGCLEIAKDMLQQCAITALTKFGQQYAGTALSPETEEAEDKKKNV